MPLDITRIHAICFDIDGTLRNTDDQYVLMLQKWLYYIRFLFTNHDYSLAARRIVMALEEPGNIFIQIPDRLGIDKPLSSIINFIDSKRNHKPTQNETIIPGVIRCLTYFYNHYPLSIVSARGELQTMRFLNQFGITSLFHCIATAQTMPHSKPFPDPLIWSSQQMGVSPEQCLMVGDTTIDIFTAKAAGAQSVGVLSGFGEEEELQRAGADLIIPSVVFLIHVLNERFLNWHKKSR